MEKLKVTVLTYFPRVVTLPPRGSWRTDKALAHFESFKDAAQIKIQ